MVAGRAGVAPASALELARQRRADNRGSRAEQLRRSRTFLERPEPWQTGHAARLAAQMESEIRARGTFRQGQQGREGRRRGKDRDHRRPRVRAALARPVGDRCQRRGHLHHHRDGCR